MILFLHLMIYFLEPLNLLKSCSVHFTFQCSTWVPQSSNMFFHSDQCYFLCTRYLLPSLFTCFACFQFLKCKQKALTLYVVLPEQHEQCFCRCVEYLGICWVVGWCGCLVKILNKPFSWKLRINIIRRGKI